jgi:AraC-like DNA-binding protein
MDRLMTYRELAPPPHLRDSVVCIWNHPGGAPSSDGPILPDGCIDIIWAEDRPPIVAGPMTVPVVSAAPAGTELIGVRFRPGAAAALLGTSAASLLNQHVALRDIWPGQRHQPWADAARDNTPDSIAAIESVLTARLAQVDSPDAFVSGAALWIATRPDLSLDVLGQRSGLSERQIRRRFDAAIGYGPKKLQRILRLQRLLWLASQHRATERTLAHLAFAAGFADQPHMTREILSLTGSTPAHLLRTSEPASAVSDLFKTPIR